MDESHLKEKLCVGVEHVNKNDEYRKIEKVLAPFLVTLKKRKRAKTDIIPDEFKDLYLLTNPQELLSKLQEYDGEVDLLKTMLNESGELLKAVTNSKCFNLYLTDYDHGYIRLVSEYVPKNTRFIQTFPIETGTYLASHVAFTKQYVVSSDILGDTRFPQGIPFAGPAVKAAICLPIITSPDDTCIGIIELYKDCPKPYTLVNVEICSALLAWVGIAMQQYQAKLNMSKEVEVHKKISILSNLYFSGALPFGKIISDILALLKTSVNAEKGSFYVFSETVPHGSNDVLYADAYEEGFTSDDMTLLRKNTKLRYSANEPGIPGYVARTGEIVNIRDAYKDSRFDRSQDSPTFRTRSLLCFPVKSINGVVAVIRLVNKLAYPYFRKEDVEILQAHVDDVGLVCQHYELDASHTKLQLKLIEQERLLDNQMKPAIDDVMFFKNFVMAEQQLPTGFSKFEWDPSIVEEDSHKYVAVSIFMSDLLESYFDLHNMAEFLLRLKKGYRSLPYHNFEHAFAVYHCLYIMLNKNRDVYNSVEVVSLVLAALCHDVDHLGLTNGFLRLKNDVLAQLYEDCCGEAHRYHFALCLIQASNVLSKFSSEKQRLIFENLKKLILGFDMGVYLNNRRTITELLNTNSLNWADPNHRFLTMNMILIAADNYYCLKNPEVSKKFTTQFYKELQHQGDLEKGMEFEPLPMMDRNKSDSIPENQITYITLICIPVFQIVVNLFPNLIGMLNLANLTLDKWKETHSQKGQEMWKMGLALVKDKRDRRSHRVSVSRSSSIKTFMSEKFN